MTSRPAPPSAPSEVAAVAPTLPAAHPRLGRLALLAFVTGFSGAAMPGPFLVATIEKTSLQGMFAVLGLVGGHALLELGIVGVLALGLNPLLDRRRVRAAIGLVGGVGLLAMGLEMMINAWDVRLNLTAGPAQAESLLKLLALGAIVSLANPYFTGWWVTVGAGQLAHMAPRTPREYLAFYLGHEAADFAWYGMVGLLIVSSRRWLTDTAYHVMILTCGVLLVGIAARFLWTGWGLLRDRERA